MKSEYWTSSCRAKLERADMHLDALYRHIDSWSNPNPCRIERESNADGSEHLFRFRIDRDPPVWNWAADMGDALHNLRCALDHIVYAFAMLHTRKNPPDGDSQLAFPICSDPKYFKAATKKRLQGIDSNVIAAIERTQPYNRTKPNGFAPLWYLAQLNDIDKHRLMPLAVFGAHHDEIVTDAAPGTFQALWNTSALIDGAPMLRLILTEPNPSVYVDLKATGAIVLNLKDHPLWGVIPLMKALRTETHLICRYLSMFGSDPT